MKEFIKKNAKIICMTGLIVCFVLFISIALGITPDDVFGNMVHVEKYDEETNYDAGIPSYDNLEPEQKDELSQNEDKTGDSITYEEFISNPPEFDGEHLYVAVNRNRPFFTKDDKQVIDTFYVYSNLDSLGRTGVAIANVTKSSFPEGIRQGDLSTVTPSGWKQIDTKEMFNVLLTTDNGATDHYLFNRCHQIAWALGGSELGKENIFTGTLSCNLTMRLFEESIWDFLDTAKDDHVLYRVTPVFKGDEPIPRGVLLEAYAVEAKGLFIDFCQYVFNAQPGFEIDYTTGDVSLSLG